MSDADQYTIGQLAKAAGVGVETVRYYQRRELLPVPEVASGFRTYPVSLVERIRFIKRAQELGFSLDEIGDLLRLEDGTHCDEASRLAEHKLQDVREKIADLRVWSPCCLNLCAPAICGREMFPAL